MATGRPKGAKDKQPRKKRTDDHRPWENSPVYQGQTQQMPEGYNTRRINFMLEIMPTEPLDKHDVAEMERRFARYLRKCSEYDMKVGNMDAYLAIGINKDEANQWVNQIKSNPERALFVKKVKNFCASYREGMMADGKVNPVTGIFWQKNYDGFRDQQEVVVSPNNPLGETQDLNSLAQKYLDNAEVAELPENTTAENHTGMTAESAEVAELSESAERPQKDPGSTND